MSKQNHDDPNLIALDRHLREAKLEGATAFEGHFFQVQRDWVNFPDADPAQDMRARREYIRHPGAAVVVPLLDDGRVLIERQFRYPLQKVFTEFPAGKIDAGEQPIQTAIRELREETGYQAGQIAHMTTIHNAIGYSDERIELYLARDLQFVGRQLDAGELISTAAVTTDWLQTQMRTGQLTDVKTQIALWWLQAYQRGEIAWPQFSQVAQ